MKYIYTETMRNGTYVYECVTDSHYHRNRLMCADRAWEEYDSGAVTIVKDRYNEFAVDMKEFMWIKLKAEFIQ